MTNTHPAATPSSDNRKMADDFIRDYLRFKQLRPVFIGGMMRSGTTLMLRLLDGHPDLLVYPFELHIINFLAYPSQYKEEAILLNKYMASKNAVATLAVLETIPNLQLSLQRNIHNHGRPLHEKWMALGSGQEITSTIDADCFRKCFISVFSSIKDSWTICDLLSIWVFSYFAATGTTNLSCKKAWVMKNADNEQCHYPIYLSGFSDCRAIHMLRDPHAFYASFMNRPHREHHNTIFAIHQYHLRMLRYNLNRWKLSEEKIADVMAQERDKVALIKYEDLIIKTPDVMKKVSDFLGVDYDPVFAQPTLSGKPWLGNSSFQLNHGIPTDIYSESLTRWKKTIYGYEKMIISSYLRKALIKYAYAKDTWILRLGDWLCGFILAIKKIIRGFFS